MENSLKALRDELLAVANDDNLTAGAKSIEQKQRNTIKRNLTDALYDVLQEIVAESTLLALYRTKEGLMVGADNAKVGIVPIEIKIAIKNLDVDPADAEDAYKEHLQEQADKKKRAEDAKAAKIARQAQERELRKQLKAVQSGEPLN